MSLRRQFMAFLPKAKRILRVEKSSPPYEGGVAVTMFFIGTDGVVFMSDKQDSAQTKNHLPAKAVLLLCKEESLR